MKTALLLFVAAAGTLFFLNFDQTKRERLVLSTTTPSGYTTPKKITRETIENRLAQVDAIAAAEPTPEQIMAEVAVAEKPAVKAVTKKIKAGKKARMAKRTKAKKSGARRTQLARR